MMWTQRTLEHDWFISQVIWRNFKSKSLEDFLSHSSRIFCLTGAITVKLRMDTIKIMLLQSCSCIAFTVHSTNSVLVQAITLEHWQIFLPIGFLLMADKSEGGRSIQIQVLKCPPPSRGMGSYFPISVHVRTAFLWFFASNNFTYSLLHCMSPCLLIPSSLCLLSVVSFFLSARCLLSTFPLGLCLHFSVPALSFAGRRGGVAGVSANEYSCTHGAQINFGDLTPYLTYGVWCLFFPVSCLSRCRLSLLSCPHGVFCLFNTVLSFLFPFWIISFFYCVFCLFCFAPSLSSAPFCLLSPFSCHAYLMFSFLLSDRCLFLLLILSFRLSVSKKAKTLWDNFWYARG